MAPQLALIVRTLRVLLLLAVLAARVRQDERIVSRFPILLAEAVVLGKVVLCIVAVAVRASPREESSQPLGLDLATRHVFLPLPIIMPISVKIDLPLLPVTV